MSTVVQRLSSVQPHLLSELRPLERKLGLVFTLFKGEFPLFIVFSSRINSRYSFLQLPYGQSYDSEKINKRTRRKRGIEERPLAISDRSNLCCCTISHPFLTSIYLHVQSTDSPGDSSNSSSRRDRPNDQSSIDTSRTNPRYIRSVSTFISSNRSDRVLMNRQQLCSVRGQLLSCS